MHLLVLLVLKFGLIENRKLDWKNRQVNNNLFVKCAYNHKLIVKTFVFKPKLGIMFLKHQCFIAQ
jgi:hypothetical protein